MKLSLLILTGLLIFSSALKAVETANPAHMNDVLQRSQKTIPFDLKQATETFSKTVHGGVLHIFVKTAGNTKQIKLIQTYLTKLVSDFSQGDFSESEQMHGIDMPGLVQLKMAKPDDIRFEYKALENGGQIHFTTEYPEYIQALHLWFDAQAHDHGNDELPEHSKHHQTISQ